VTSADFMTRRAFLVSSTKVGAGAVLFLGLVGATGCGRDDEALLLDVLEIFPQQGFLRKVGRQVLADASNTRTADQLTEEIFSYPRWRSGRDPQQLFVEQVSEDFAEDRVLTVQGWVLSRSEAQLAALVLLLR
jgi:hypothetical protein